MRPPALLLLLVCLAGTVPALPARAANIEVVGNSLRVTVPRSTDDFFSTGATVDPVDGGAQVSFYGAHILQSDQTAGAGCQALPPPSGIRPAPFGTAHFSATCNLSEVTEVRGTLGAQTHSQAWASSIDLPTTIVTASGPPDKDRGDFIRTGPGADRIDAGAGDDRIDPGSSPYGALPPPGTKLPDVQNLVNAGAGNDTIDLSGATGHDVVNGGTGTDTVTFAGRFVGPGVPGLHGVDVSLDGLRNDGDPAIDPPDSDNPGEGDNVAADVENVIGSRREDILVGGAGANRLEGLDSADTLRGLGGADALMAREPGLVGLKDTLSCGAPLAPVGQSASARESLSGVDSLDADLRDVPPADCETLTQGAVNEGPNVIVARAASRAPRGRLRARLRCPRAAGRTCAGTLRLAGRTGRKGPTTAFSILRGKSKSVDVSPPAGSALPSPGLRFTARLLGTERGRHGRITTVAYTEVRK